MCMFIQNNIHHFVLLLSIYVYVFQPLILSSILYVILTFSYCCTFTCNMYLIVKSRPFILKITVAGIFEIMLHVAFSARIAATNDPAQSKSIFTYLVAVKCFYQFYIVVSKALHVSK